MSSDSNNGAVYASDEGLHSIIVGNASLTANFSTGYTKLFEDMSANSHVDLNGFNIANGLVLLTGLKRLTDVQVSYEDGNAIVTEAAVPRSTRLICADPPAWQDIVQPDRAAPT